MRARRWDRAARQACAPPPHPHPPAPRPRPAAPRRSPADRAPRRATARNARGRPPATSRRGRPRATHPRQPPTAAPRRSGARSIARATPRGAGTVRACRSHLSSRRRRRRPLTDGARAARHLSLALGVGRALGIVPTVGHEARPQRLHGPRIQELDGFDRHGADRVADLGARQLSLHPEPENEPLTLGELGERALDRGPHGSAGARRGTASPLSGPPCLARRHPAGVSRLPLGRRPLCPSPVALPPADLLPEHRHRAVARGGGQIHRQRAVHVEIRTPVPQAGEDVLHDRPRRPPGLEIRIGHAIQPTGMREEERLERALVARHDPREERGVVHRVAPGVAPAAPAAPTPLPRTASRSLGDPPRQLSHDGGPLPVHPDQDTGRQPRAERTAVGPPRPPGTTPARRARRTRPGSDRPLANAATRKTPRPPRGSDHGPDTHADASACRHRLTGQPPDDGELAPSSAPSPPRTTWAPISRCTTYSASVAAARADACDALYIVALYMLWPMHRGGCTIAPCHRCACASDGRSPISARRRRRTRRSRSRTPSACTGRSSAWSNAVSPTRHSTRSRSSRGLSRCRRRGCSRSPTASADRG